MDPPIGVGGGGGGGGGDPYHLLLSDPLLSIVDNSLHHSKYFLAPASLAFRQAFSKLSGAFAIFLSGAKTDVNVSNSTIQSKHISQYYSPVGTPSCFRFPHQSLKSFFRAAAHTFKPLPPILSLAAMLIPPLHHFTPSFLAIPPVDAATYPQMSGSADTSPCNVQHPGCVLPQFDWTTHTVEPKTGIQFPGVLNTTLPNHNQSNLSSEVLVGTGSRIMTLIKIKSLKVYAFGFYVHSSSLCQKLGSKYGSVPEVELKERSDFYADLLREDVGMTVRLVVNYNGMKINTVKDAFEKSLRARLAKTNPETDFKCISTFGSYFTKDIPLPVGTIIDFRRTSDGQLITEIGGNQIGAVHSRELCRAFFDMYLGEVPVSEQTKEEIGRNVATIIRRC